MSIAAYSLRLKASYTLDVPFDMDTFRATLRATREKFGGREKLAGKIGIAKSTIQSAELGPDIPQIDTVARIIEGSGLTLSEFFAVLENPRADLQNEVLRDEPQPVQDAASVIDEVRPHGPPLPPVVIGHAELQELGRIIGHAIRDAARSQQAPSTRARKS